MAGLLRLHGVDIIAVVICFFKLAFIEYLVTYE